MICSFEVVLHLIASLRVWKLLESDFRVIPVHYLIKAFLRASVDDTAKANKSLPIVSNVLSHVLKHLL